MIAAASRVTINLIPTATEDLDYLIEQQRLGKTDVINRAIQMAAIWHRAEAAGKEWLQKDPATGEIARVIIH